MDAAKYDPVTNEIILDLEKADLKKIDGTNQYTISFWWNDINDDKSYSFHGFVKFLVEDLSSYSIVYTDGVADEEIFADQENMVKEGATTPIFEGKTEREGYTFEGWSPEVSDKVTDNVTYVAQWKKIDKPIIPVEPVEPTEPVKPTEPKLPNTGMSNNVSGLIFVVVGGLLTGYSFVHKKRKQMK